MPLGYCPECNKVIDTAKVTTKTPEVSPHTAKGVRIDIIKEGGAINQTSTETNKILAGLNKPVEVKKEEVKA